METLLELEQTQAFVVLQSFERTRYAVRALVLDPEKIKQGIFATPF